MGIMDVVAARVAAGETVRFKPTGSSMAPLIHSRQQVTVAPVDASRIAAGDIVPVTVSGSVHLHLVTAPAPPPAPHRAA